MGKAMKACHTLSRLDQSKALYAPSLVITNHSLTQVLFLHGVQVCESLKLGL